MNLGCFRLYDDVILPQQATSGSACFDVSCYLNDSVPVTVYDMSNGKSKRYPEWANEKLQLIVYPADRVLVPTGIVFDIPTAYSVRLHTRSSISLKRGLIMPNGEGIIDSDYHHETFVMLMNASADTVIINNKERIAQAEVVQTEFYNIEEVKHRPEQTTERVGGFGSTGKV
jgi:dUTP pyrophosphatase